MRSCCDMENYNCAQCQLVMRNWCSEVCGYLIPPRKWGDGQGVLPGMQDMACLRAVIWCLKLTIEGYCLEWPAQVSLSIGLHPPGPISAAVDLTPFLTSSSTSFSLSCPVETADYLWTVAIIRRRSLEDIQRIASCRTEKRETSLNFLFSDRNQTQIHLLSASSPTPVRGSLCTHFACFDKLAYLSFQSRQPIPDCICPKCLKPCLEFRLDDLFNQLQTQYGPGTVLTVTPANLPSEPQPTKRVKCSTKPIFTFPDFLNSTSYLERVTDSMLYSSPAYSGIESLWQELTTGSSQCKDGSNSGLLEVNVLRIDTPVDVDADSE